MVQIITMVFFLLFTFLLFILYFLLFPSLWSICPFNDLLTFFDILKTPGSQSYSTSSNVMSLSQMFRVTPMWLLVSRVSQRISIWRLVKCVFEDTSVLHHCYYAFILRILEYCSPVWGSAAECHLQVLECHVYSVAQLCPAYQTFLLLCHWCHVAALCTLYKVNSNHCLFSELPSASVRLTYSSCSCSSSIRVWSIKV